MGSTSIYLEWEPNAPSENISEYQIYRAEYFDNQDSLGEFNRISAIEPSSQQITEYVDASTAINTTFYYRLRAIDQSDNSSEYSDTLFYKLLPQVGIEGMVPDGVDISLSESRSLRWSWNWRTPLERYTITVVTLNYELIVRDVFLPSNYTGERERWDIPSPIVLEPNRMYKWRVDMGAQFLNGRETASSESHWATFRYSQP